MISVYYYPYITDEQAKEEGGSMTCPMSHGQEVAKSGDFPGRPGVGTLHSKVVAYGFDPWLGELESHMFLILKTKT